MSRQFWSSAFAFGRRLAWLLLPLGIFIGWAIINLSQPPGVVITTEAEAEGPMFSSTDTLDLDLKIKRNRPCPSTTQRWVWRWIPKLDAQGWPIPLFGADGKPVMGPDGKVKYERKQQAIPLPSTLGPFLADTDEMVLSIPSTGIPDPTSGKWFFRSVTTEMCGFLPTWASALTGERMFRSHDVPVNFAGLSNAGHDPTGLPGK